MTTSPTPVSYTHLVVSTSLIEAGVDVDFPAAYREQCGLDSLLQTAGRCNREGRRGTEESIVYRFRLDECSTPQMLRQNVSALDYTARHQDTLDTPRAIPVSYTHLHPAPRAHLYPGKVSGREGLSALR